MKILKRFHKMFPIFWFATRAFSLATPVTHLSFLLRHFIVTWLLTVGHQGY